MKTPKLKLVVVALAATLATAQAQILIGVQFPGDGGSYTALTSGETAGVVPQAHWNVQPGGFTPVSPLVDSTTGLASGVSYALSGFTNLYHTTMTITTPDTKLLSGIIGPVSGIATITLSGLTDGTQYDFYLYAVNNGGSVGAKITAGGTSYYSTNQTAVEYAASPGFVQGTATTTGTRSVANYVKFSGLTSSGTNLTVTVDGDSDYYPAFNGFQIQAVPEPATWALLAGGMTVVTILRRRRLR